MTALLLACALFRGGYVGEIHAAPVVTLDGVWTYWSGGITVAAYRSTMIVSVPDEVYRWHHFVVARHGEAKLGVALPRQ